MQIKFESGGSNIKPPASSSQDIKRPLSRPLVRV